MLTDIDSMANRATAIELINKIRTTPVVKGRGKPRVVRRFVKPHINMAATAYTEMVNLDEIQLYEPPITIGLPLEVLAKCLDDWDALKLPQLSSNNIPLERLIRISSEVCSVSPGLHFNERIDLRTENGEGLKSMYGFFHLRDKGT